MLMIAYAAETIALVSLMLWQLNLNKTFHQTSVHASFVSAERCLNEWLVVMEEPK